MAQAVSFSFLSLSASFSCYNDVGFQSVIKNTTCKCTLADDLEWCVVGMAIEQHLMCPVHPSPPVIMGT